MSVVHLNPCRSELDVGLPDRTPLEVLHRRLPGYAPTALLEARTLARDWNVGRVLIKAETDRLGLPAFKVLGCSWAVYVTLLDAHQLPTTTPYSDELRRQLAAGSIRRLVTATDGNHGRAVAWTARLFGLQAEVVVPEGTAAVRISAIEGEGASVRVAAGDYDAACGVAAEAADSKPGALLVQDTWWPGHEQVPARIVQGYGTLFHEVDDATSGTAIDLVVVPVGVGSLAAAAVGHFAAQPTSLVSVEPTDAACVLASCRAGYPVVAPGPYATAMAGLNCGTPSALAWPLLSARLDACTAVTDQEAAGAMRALHRLGLAAGATGAACMAGAEAVCRDPDARVALGVSDRTTLLLLVTEGVTDPEHFTAVSDEPTRRGT